MNIFIFVTHGISMPYHVNIVVELTIYIIRIKSINSVYCHTTINTRAKIEQQYTPSVLLENFLSGLYSTDHYN